MREHRACLERSTRQGPLYNPVRSPTAEDCLGNYVTWQIKEVCITNDIYIYIYMYTHKIQLHIAEQSN